MLVRKIGLLLIAFICLFSSKGQELRHKKINKILILGNSIVAHDPKPEIGWTGNWGMAASCRDSDFVHILTREIQQVNPSAVIKYINIADFERGYKTYSLSKLNDARFPDLLIVKLSENVDDKNAEKDSFIFYYNQLLNYVAPPQKNTVKVLLDGFWVNRNVNSMIKDYAQRNGSQFVEISDLSSDSTNTAKGLFEHTGVASHPSDKGMRLIEQRIWTAVKNYFVIN